MIYIESLNKNDCKNWS